MEPFMLLQMAVKHGATPEAVERLVELALRLKAENAKQAFDAALAAAQAEMPVIPRASAGAMTRQGKVMYRYAALEDIWSRVAPVFGKHGLSVTWETSMNEEKVEVSCVLSHVAGHSEKRSVTLPLLEGTGVMSAAQRAAGTITMGKRYSLMSWGIVAEGEDNESALTATDDAIEAELNLALHEFPHEVVEAHLARFPKRDAIALRTVLRHLTDVQEGKRLPCKLCREEEKEAEE